MAYCNNNELPRRNDFTLIRGDTFTIAIRMTMDGNTVNMEDGYAYFALSAEGQIICAKRYGSAQQDKDGYVNIILLPEDTERLAPGLYQYEIEFRLTEATVYTLVNGEINVHADLITTDVRNDAKEADICLTEES